jgi:hypothetical protein
MLLLCLSIETFSCTSTIIIYSGSSTHRSVFQGGPAIYIYIIYVKLHYDYIKIIKYLQIFKDYIYLIVVGKSSVQLDKVFVRF